MALLGRLTGAIEFDAAVLHAGLAVCADRLAQGGAFFIRSRTAGNAGGVGAPLAVRWQLAFFGRPELNLLTTSLKTATLVVAAAALLVAAGCAVTRLGAASELAKASEPLQVSPQDPTRRLLIVGDSTAVGTGASSPQASVAGLIARDHPSWTIVNRARDGARFADFEAQLASAERFDLVLVMGGGNDTIRLTGQEALRASVRRTAERAKSLADAVILMPPGNVGNAPFFFAPVSWLMTHRSRSLHAVVEEAARATGAVYVDLYKDRADDPFALEPERFHARDGLHPSDDGYRLWYRDLVLGAASVL